MGKSTYKTTKPTKKTRKKKKKGFRVLGTVFFVLFVVLALCASVIAGMLVGFSDNTTDLIAEEYNLDFTSIIYYIDNDSNQPVELDRIHRAENRVWVDIENVPENLTNAFIAIEDERFRDHKGVDVKRTIGAFMQWARGKDSYGGSTITQQLIKNVTGENDKSPKRKIEEIIRAINLETKMSKDQIIEMYMNTIYFGGGCHGVQTAANHYFSKDVSELTLEECASLAGIVKAPTTYNPVSNFENNKARQEVILTKMAELGFVSQQESDDAKAKKLNIKVGTKNENVSADVKSYFVDAVVDDVVADLMEKENLTEAEATNRLYTGGFKIYSTLDPKVQNAIDDVYKNPANFPGSSGNRAESAIVVMDPYTGQIKGLSGGIGEKTVPRSLNRATQSKRQPGSAIKPLAVYGPAVEYNVITPATLVNDSKLTIGDWSPKNSGGGYKGKLSARRHLELSRNIPAVKIMQELTVDKSFDFMTKNLGFTTLVAGEKNSEGKLITDKSLSMALGGLTYGVTVEEMTAAYATFVNAGQYNKPVTYTKVIDANGRIILENKVQNKRAMSPETAYIMQNMMSGVVKSGTGTAASLGDIYAGGKTGTTNSNKDRWFMGFTPNYVAGVWTGYDQPKAMGGSNLCPGIWKRVMTKIHEGETIKTIKQPDGVVKRTVCALSGRIASDICSTTRVDYFKEGTQPKKYCSSHAGLGVSTSEETTASPSASASASITPGNPGATEELPENAPAVSPGTVIPNEASTPDVSSSEGTEGAE